MVFDDLDELAALRASVETPTSGYWRSWVGYARDTNSNPFVFHAVTGEELPYPGPLWQQGEPNNGLGTGAEEALWFSIGENLTDAPWDFGIDRYFCECDGRADTSNFVLLPP